MKDEIFELKQRAMKSRLESLLSEKLWSCGKTSSSVLPWSNAVSILAGFNPELSAHWPDGVCLLPDTLEFYSFDRIPTTLDQFLKPAVRDHIALLQGLRMETGPPRQLIAHTLSVGIHIPWLSFALRNDVLPFAPAVISNIGALMKALPKRQIDEESLHAVPQPGTEMTLLRRALKGGPLSPIRRRGSDFPSDAICFLLGFDPRKSESYPDKLAFFPKVRTHYGFDRPDLETSARLNFLDDVEALGGIGFATAKPENLVRKALELKIRISWIDAARGDPVCKDLLQGISQELVDRSSHVTYREVLSSKGKDAATARYSEKHAWRDGEARRLFDELKMRNFEAIKPKRRTHGLPSFTAIANWILDESTVLIDGGSPYEAIDFARIIKRWLHEKDMPDLPI